jgi:hypothetical protein
VTVFSQSAFSYVHTGSVFFISIFVSPRIFALGYHLVLATKNLQEEAL